MVPPPPLEEVPAYDGHRRQDSLSDGGGKQVEMYFEADRFVSRLRCGQDHLAFVPGCGLFEAEEV